MVLEGPPAEAEYTLRFYIAPLTDAVERMDEILAARAQTTIYPIKSPASYHLDSVPPKSRQVTRTIRKEPS